MTKNNKGLTKALFGSLTKLYKQGQLLLMDADRLMEERGWTPLHNSAVAGLSNAMDSPQRWYARWAMRFYIPAATEGKEPLIDRILFVSIHFASDINTGFETSVDEPFVCAGRLLYEKAMTPKEADNNYDYWMCKYWFSGKRHETLKDWRKCGRSRLEAYKNLQGSETFDVPLYNITSSKKLEELVIAPLLAVQDRAKRIT